MHRTEQQGSVGRVNGVNVWTARAALIAAVAATSAAACVLDDRGTGPDQGAGGSGGPGATTGASGGGAPAARGYRRRIAVHADATMAVPAGYSVSIAIDHAALVQEGKSLPGGDDVRIVHGDSDAAQEIDRVIDPESAWEQAETVLWFSTQAEIGAGQSDDAYFVVYGGSTATLPLADAGKVFVLWDDFDQGLGPRWTYDNIGNNASGLAEVSGGAVRITARTGDVDSQHDDFAFLHTGISGDFVAEALVTQFGGDLDSSAKLGGVMVRQSVDPGSRFYLACRRNDDHWISAFRTSDGDAAYSQAFDAGPFHRERARVFRLGSTTWADWSEGVGSWSPAAQVEEFSTPLLDPVLVGIPLATRVPSSDGFVEVDWFRVRRLVYPEPSAAMGGQEVAP